MFGHHTNSPFGVLFRGVSRFTVCGFMFLGAVIAGLKSIFLTLTLSCVDSLIVPKKKNQKQKGTHKM
eukprot:NODE_5591_length_281_cov_35.323276_g5508_i0.p1 GENE.NODE_5591_length_281_cov_35.323276_g5508_i0~~NODE_5591_length_281_cov_35.323276_g5508_i0.p1  ORF type:complete len:67 (-),score=5.27 NODE_5591_length_281_cov_35.323276_g5508_i0:8-208(-)